MTQLKQPYAEIIFNKEMHTNHSIDSDWCNVRNAVSWF